VAGGLERGTPQVAAVVAGLSDPAQEPEQGAGAGGRPEESSGPRGRPEERAGQAGCRGDAEPVVPAAGGVVWRRGEGDRVEVVLVHRPRYGDWSLPKGKLDPGEDHQTAALREVQEETGLRCELDERLPVNRYRDRKGRPKVVHYWLMHPVGGASTPRAYATDEIDEAVWRSTEEAKAMATYERDRELIDTAATLVRART
jgi:8-oxo-dGTP diphosphatase